MQRQVLLYGVGKGRDDTTKQVRKLTKDVVKLFTKKFSIDVSDGGKVKKHSKSDFIFETVAQKFQVMTVGAKYRGDLNSELVRYLNGPK